MFNPDKALEVQERKFAGEWKSCMRTGAAVLLSHPGNPEFLRELARLEKVERVRLGLTGRNIDKPLPDEVAAKVNFQAISTKLVLNWRKVVSKDGEEIPYDASLCAEFLKNIVDFRIDVTELISSAADAEIDEREVLSGNS